MSFHKKRLPPLSELIENHKRLGDDYLKDFFSADALIGPKESSDYLDDFIKSKKSISKLTETLSGFISELQSLSQINYSEEIEALYKIKETLTHKNQ